jgi:hypothetical protein
MKNGTEVRRRRRGRECALRELANLVPYAPRTSGLLPTAIAAPGNVRRWIGFSTTNPASRCHVRMLSSR